MARPLFKSTLMVGFMTLISRVLGFVRDMLIAQVFGVSPATDAFFAVFKIPNFFRRLFAEGVFTQTLMPVLSDCQSQGGLAGLKRFSGKAAGTLCAGMAPMIITGIMAAPVLVSALAPGFGYGTEQFRLAVELLQIMQPYLLLVALVSLAASVLNIKGRFAVPALTPVVLNVAMIIAALKFAPIMAEPIKALAWAVLAAGAVQCLVQIPALLKLKLLPAFSVDFADPGIQRVLKQLLPAVFAVSVTQINLLVDTLIASFLAAGSVSWLYYSDRLVEFPLGLFGVAVATVILPGLAKSYSQDNPEAFSAAIDWGMRLVLFIALPASTGLFMLAEPMLSTLFEYREFDAQGVHQAGLSLKAYSLGLLGFILVRVLVPGFSAREDMKTPARYGVYTMLANLFFNGLLVFPLAHAGLALATSLGAFVNAGLLLWKLRKDQIYRPGSGWSVLLLRLTLATLTMAVVLYFGVDAGDWQHWQAQQRVLHLLAWIFAGMLVYLAVLLVSGFKIRHLAI
ncbi:MAG: murein biosynthesis integral membrane protein MurJ [Methylomonas sp.]|nr:MAG: murein biosynthesis integral membrane protein MurJ [Methylomonas sp.]